MIHACAQNAHPHIHTHPPTYKFKHKKHTYACIPFHTFLPKLCAKNPTITTHTHTHGHTSVSWPPQSFQNSARKAPAKRTDWTRSFASSPVRKRCGMPMCLCVCIDSKWHCAYVCGRCMVSIHKCVRVYGGTVCAIAPAHVLIICHITQTHVSILFHIHANTRMNTNVIYAITCIIHTYTRINNMSFTHINMYQ